MRGHRQAAPVSASNGMAVKNSSGLPRVVRSFFETAAGKQKNKSAAD